MTSNRRKNKRYDCFVPIDTKKGGQFDMSQTVDISKGGVGFVSHKSIPLNKEVAMELVLSETGESVLVMGKVKWVVPIKNTETFRVGFIFNDIMQGSKIRFGAYFKDKKD